MAKKKETKVDLPPGVTEGDLKYPGQGEWLSWEQRKELGVEASGLTFYKVKNRGWVLTTLHISNASRGSSAPARTYGIGLEDSKVYTVGRGPHVEAEVEVYLSKDNIDRLTKYVELWKKGMADASLIRDRISSRRAQGQAHRAAGRTHWTW